MQKTLRFCVVFTVLAFAACRGGASRDQHIKQGDQYLANKQYREAILEYKKAVQADQKSGPTHQKLGDAYLQSRDYVNAFRQFVLAADMMPDDTAAQLKAGYALLLVNNFEDARGRAEIVLAKDPQNADAHILRGNAMAGLRDLPNALDDMRSAIAADPSRSAGYSNLGAIQAATGELEKSEASFKQAIAAEPNAPIPRLALANLYWSMGRWSETERLIQEAVKLEPDNPLTNQALAMLYLGTRRMAEAEAPLKVVAAHSDGPEAKLMLADYYVNSQRLPEAKALYDELANGKEGATTAKLRLASLGLFTGDKKSAYDLIDGVLAKEPKNAQALVARAQLEFIDGKSAEALASAQAAMAADPKAPLPQFVAGLILKSQYQVEEATAAFKAALQLSTGYAPPNVELARLAIAAGRFQDAAKYAQAAIDQTPTFGEAYLLLVRATVSMGNLAAAEAPVKLMASNFPNAPAVQAELGRFLLMRGDTTRATAAFGLALSKDPLNVTALEGMVAVDLQEKRTAAARKRLDDAVAASPASSGLQIMAARLYAGAFHDFAAAEAAVQRALAADPNNLPAFALLAQVYVQSNNLPAATKKLEDLAARQPRSVTTHTAIGVLYELQGRRDLAEAAYKRALALDQAAPVAANNLAQLYVDRNENLEMALQYAQAARTGLPQSHEVADTLGWVYYKKGLAASAITVLKQAVAAEPSNAVYLYHLGAAYAMNKDKINARQTLEKALKLQPGFPGADDARRILDSLKG